MKNVFKSVAYKYLKKCPVLHYVLKVWMISCFAMALKLSEKILTFNLFCFQNFSQFKRKISCVMHQNKNNSIVIEELLASIRVFLQSVRQIQYMVNCYFCFQAKNKYILPARESVKSMLVWGWALEQDHQRQAANRDSMRRRMSKDGVCITANIFILVRIFFFSI